MENKNKIILTFQSKLTCGTHLFSIPLLPMLHTGINFRVSAQRRLSGEHRAVSKEFSQCEKCLHVFDIFDLFIQMYPFMKCRQQLEDYTSQSHSHFRHGVYSLHSKQMISELKHIYIILYVYKQAPSATSNINKISTTC